MSLYNPQVCGLYDNYAKNFYLLEGTTIRVLPKNYKGEAYSTLYDALWYAYNTKIMEEVIICIAHPSMTEEEEDLLHTLRDFLIKKSKDDKAEALREKDIMKCWELRNGLTTIR